MAEGELVRWVKKELKKGHTPTQIYHFLLHHKHHPDHVHDALKKAHHKPLYSVNYIPFLLGLVVVGMFIGSIAMYYMLETDCNTKQPEPVQPAPEPEPIPVVEPQPKLDESEVLVCSSPCETCRSGLERRLREVTTNETRCVQCALDKHCLDGYKCTGFMCVGGLVE